jgi:hypothetical protein
MSHNDFATPFHELNTGSMAQVLSPGISDANICTRNISPYAPFELVLLGWLCEVASDRAIPGNCPDASKKSHIVSPPNKETGHHDILASRAYGKVGCAWTGKPGAGQCDAFTGFVSTSFLLLCEDWDGMGFHV